MRVIHVAQSFVWVFVSQWKCSKNQICDGSSHPVYIESAGRIQEKNHQQQQQQQQQEQQSTKTVSLFRMCRSVSPTLEQVAAFAAFVRMLDIFLVLVFRNCVSCVLCVVLCCAVLCAPIARIFFSFLSTPSSICVSKTQWFPLNMLIEIAYKFREHLCSSPMSQTFVRCFSEPDFRFFSRFGVCVFFYASISILVSVSYFPWRTMHSCVRATEWEWVSIVRWCVQKQPRPFSMPLMYAFYISSAQKSLNPTKNVMRNHQKRTGPEHKKERKKRTHSEHTATNEMHEQKKTTFSFVYIYIVFHVMCNECIETCERCAVGWFGAYRGLVVVVCVRNFEDDCEQHFLCGDILLFCLSVFGAVFFTVRSSFSFCANAYVHTELVSMSEWVSVRLLEQLTLCYRPEPTHRRFMIERKFCCAFSLFLFFCRCCCCYYYILCYCCVNLRRTAEYFVSHLVFVVALPNGNVEKNSLCTRLFFIRSELNREHFY